MKLMRRRTIVNPRRRRSSAVSVYRFNDPDPRRRYRRRARRNNPRRSYYRRRYRRNPALPLNIDRVAMQGLKIAGGIAIGVMGIPVIANYLPSQIRQYRNLYGLLHITVGAAGAAFIRNKDIKDMMIVVAGVGVYDLISQNLKFLGLPELSSEMPAFLAPKIAEKEAGEEEGVVGAGADYAPALGASYDVMGASYSEVGGDDISYGDEIEIG